MATSSTVPQVLTRSVVPQLSAGLDAGDILECYALIRPAQLHNPMMPDATMTIHKVAIGLRYRPLKMNDMAEGLKIREITLEYGPGRMGVSLLQESMPSVLVEQEPVGGIESGAGSNSNLNSNSSLSRSFVTWENEGKIYYTTQIGSTGYISAYYMASVTGSVLERLLEKAVDYPMQNAHIRGRSRRYQPFVVVDGKNEQIPPPGFEGDINAYRKVLLRSSSSTDFMEYMWSKLAELGVNMHPILTPPTYQVQLVASGVEKVKVGPPDWATQPAALFYERLYQCIEAKVTGDYSKYAKPTPMPTENKPPSQAPSVAIEVTPAPTHFSNSSNPEDGEANDNESTSDDGSGGKRSLRADFPGTPQLRETDPPIDALRNIETLIHDNSTISGNSTAEDILNVHEDVPPSVEPIQVHDSLGDTDSLSDNNTLPMSAAPSISSAPTVSPAPSIAPSVAPTVYKVNKKDTKSEVDEAQEAADQAKQAAAEAKDAAKTETDTKAADAAQVAAQAAQKAADATSSAAAQAALESLLSGDGNIMLSVVTPCLSDPQFGIALPGANDTVISQAYLYIDGSSYYKVNLTYPYIQVVPVDHRLPTPRDFGGPGSGAEFIDWTLALMLLFVSIFGILMLIQQVFGGHVKLVQPLYNFQLWFFNPLHHEEIKGNFEEEKRMSMAGQGRGQAYNFGQDVIPVSMGGKRIPIIRSTGRTFLGNPTSDQRDDEHEREPLNGSGEHQQAEMGSSLDLQEIEMTEKSSPSRRSFDELQRGSSGASNDSGDSASSPSRLNHHHGDNGINSGKVVGNMELVEKDHRIRENGVPRRFRRDPDLVDMPNLKSTSKVAIPVGLKRQRSFISIGGNTL